MTDDKKYALKKIQDLKSLTGQIRGYGEKGSYLNKRALFSAFLDIAESHVRSVSSSCRIDAQTGEVAVQITDVDLVAYLVKQGYIDGPKKKDTLFASDKMRNIRPMVRNLRKTLDRIYSGVEIERATDRYILRTRGQSRMKSEDEAAATTTHPLEKAETLMREYREQAEALKIRIPDTVESMCNEFSCRGYGYSLAAFNNNNEQAELTIALESRDRLDEDLDFIAPYIRMLWPSFIKLIIITFAGGTRPLVFDETIISAYAGRGALTKEELESAESLAKQIDLNKHSF